jgi:predicted ester cyclase
MTADQRLRVMSRYNELWHPSGLDQAPEVIDERFTRYGSSGRFEGVPAFQRYVRHYLTAFPDLQFAVDDWLWQAEKVLVRYSFTGTHQGPFMGVVATGRKVAAEGAAIYRIVGGKLLELWDYLDLFGLGRQLGVHAQTIDPTLSLK